MLTPTPVITSPLHPWVNYSMRERAVATLREVQALNPDYAPPILAGIDRLIADILNDAPLRMPPDSGLPDTYHWEKAWLTRRDESWLNTQWFFAEVFIYRHLIELVDWFTSRRDPFAPRKREELASPMIRERLEQAMATHALPPDERLRAAFHNALWGNRIDLSYALSMAHGSTVGDDDLIVDESDAVIAHLHVTPGAIHIVLDNFGTEYACDLALIDCLLETAERPIIAHYKAHPTFVSDVTLIDDRHFRDLLRAGTYGSAGIALHDRLSAHAERLTLRADWVWNSPALGIDLPESIREVFNGAALVIFKGDLNYRRMVGDTLWPPTTPFPDVTEYFPAPMLMLRTLKSETVCGLPPGMAERLDAVDQRWRVDGRRGLIQFKGR